MTTPPPPRPPELNDQQISALAHQKRKEWWPGETLPVDIELIIETKLDIAIDPVAMMRDEAGVDACLSSDRSLLHVDLNYYINPKMLGRVRFSLAHEVGHWVLHKDLFDCYLAHAPDNPIQWARLVREIYDDYAYLYEHQADEFASCLLVPESELRQIAGPILDTMRSRIPGLDNFSGDSVRNMIAPKINQHFGVSPGTIEVRLRKYGIV